MQRGYGGAGVRRRGGTAARAYANTDATHAHSGRTVRGGGGGGGGGGLGGGLGGG